MLQTRTEAKTSGQSANTPPTAGGQGLESDPQRSCLLLSGSPALPWRPKTKGAGDVLGPVSLTWIKAELRLRWAPGCAGDGPTQGRAEAWCVGAVSTGMSPRGRLRGWPRWRPEAPLQGSSCGTAHVLKRGWKVGSHRWGEPVLPLPPSLRVLGTAVGRSQGGLSPRGAAGCGMEALFVSGRAPGFRNLILQGSS